MSVHPRHSIVSIPHLSTSYPTVPSRALLHLWWKPRNSLHHCGIRRVRHSRMRLVLRDHICGTHDWAQHWNAAAAPTLGGVYSVGLLWNGAVRHRRRGTSVHHWIPNHLIREWRWDGAHHRSRILTRWSRTLVYRKPHRLRMHIWGTMTAGHHPTGNWTTLCVHHLSGSRGMAR